MELTQNVAEPLLSEKDIARLLNRSVTSIRADRAAGHGVPFIRVGRQIRYEPQAFRNFIARLRELA